MSEPLTEVSAWSEEDMNEGEWPYPTTYEKSQVHGELADRCRKALGVDSDAPVYITEQVDSAGYSEWTQENFRTFTIECSVHRKTFDEDWKLGDSTFAQLLKWLDDNE